MTDYNEAIRPIHDRMPVPLHFDEYNQWLHGSFEDAVAFRSRCFRDELIEIVGTSELWSKRTSADTSPPGLAFPDAERSQHHRFARKFLRRSSICPAKRSDGGSKPSNRSYSGRNRPSMICGSWVPISPMLVVIARSTLSLRAR